MATLPSLSVPGMNPAPARCLDAVKDLYYLSQTSVFRCLIMLLALAIRLHLLMRHGVWENVIEAVEIAEAVFNSFPYSSLPLSSASTTQHLSAPQGPNLLSFSADPTRHLPSLPQPSECIFFCPHPLLFPS